MSFDLGPFASISALEQRQTAYVPPYPGSGAPSSLQSLSPSASFARLFEDSTPTMDVLDDILDPAAFDPEPSGSDGYASATSLVEPSRSPHARSPQPVQYASWPTTLPSSVPMPMPGLGPSVFGTASPASSLGTMSPPGRFMATPPRPRTAEQTSGVMRSPKRMPIPLSHPGSPGKPYNYGLLPYQPPPPQLDYGHVGRRDVTPRSSSGMVRLNTHPPSPSRRRTTSTMSRRDDPTAATATLPGSPQQRARTASRPMTMGSQIPASGPIPLNEVMVALDVIKQFIKEREACEQAGCVNCGAGGSIAGPEHVRAVDELGERVRQRLSMAATNAATSIPVPPRGT